MKKIIVLSIIIFACLTAFSQKIKVEEDYEKIGEGSNNALVVVIYGASDKQVEKAWRDLVKDYNPEKTSTVKGDMFADNATISSISLNTIDIYARAEKEGDNVKLIVGFDLGGAFLSSSLHSSEYKSAERIVYNFALEQTKKAIEAQLKEAEKEKESLDKDLEKLIKENEKLNGNIEKWTQEIEQAKKDIETNAKDQENKKQEIENQLKIVEEIKDKQSKVE